MATIDTPVLAAGHIHVQAIVTTADGLRLGDDIGVVVSDPASVESQDLAECVLVPALAACAGKIAERLASQLNITDARGDA